MNDVKLFSIGCPKCNVLKNKLDEKCISYTEISDEKEIEKFGITRVPVLFVNDTFMEFRDAVDWVNKQGGNK